MSTEQQTENLRAIYEMARPLIEQAKREAVSRGDFDSSIGAASRQADIERALRSRGVPVPTIKAEGQGFIILETPRLRASAVKHT